MSSRLRVSSLAVLALVAVPVLSACNTSPGAAATIGSKRISTGALQTQVSESLAGGQVQKQQGFTAANFTRSLLGHMIGVSLVNSLAAEKHVTVTPQDISAQTASFVQQAGSLTALHTQAAQGGVTLAQLPGFIRYAALQEKIGNALAASVPVTQAQLQAEYQKDIDQFDQLDVAQIEVQSKSLAQRILAKVRAKPATFGALAAKYSVDTATKDKGGAVGLVGTSQVVKVLGGDAAKAKPNTFAIAQPSANQYVVIHIIMRQVQPLSAVTQQLKTSLSASQAQALLQKAVTAEAVKLGVHVSPRYGHWDNATGTVVETKSSVSSSG